VLLLTVYASLYLLILLCLPVLHDDEIVVSDEDVNPQNRPANNLKYVPENDEQRDPSGAPFDPLR
jgi:hypothetical protein